MIERIRAEIVRVGWSKTARLSGVDRVTLHRVFGEGSNQSPNLRTVQAVLPVLGLRLTIAEMQR